VRARLDAEERERGDRRAFVGCRVESHWRRSRISVHIGNDRVVVSVRRLWRGSHRFGVRVGSLRAFRALAFF
jgi:tRNA A-37 threonylcarbamoyl transferase component Bud32